MTSKQTAGSQEAHRIQHELNDSLKRKKSREIKRTSLYLLNNALISTLWFNRFIKATENEFDASCPSLTSSIHFIRVLGPEPILKNILRVWHENTPWIDVVFMSNRIWRRRIYIHCIGPAEIVANPKQRSLGSKQWEPIKEKYRNHFSKTKLSLTRMKSWYII